MVYLDTQELADIAEFLVSVDILEEVVTQEFKVILDIPELVVIPE